jgi:hypothetical protein
VTSPSPTITGIEPRVLSAQLLANGRSLPFKQTEQGLQIDVPQDAPDNNVAVVALRTLTVKLEKGLHLLLRLCQDSLYNPAFRFSIPLQRRIKGRS